MTDKVCKSKKRPVLIVSNVDSNRLDKDYIVLPITKKVRDEPCSLLIEPSDVSGALPITSELRCNKPFTLRQELIQELIGVLDQSKTQLAVQLITEATQLLEAKQG